MSATAANRQEFVSSAINWLRDNNFDGLDLDWEYPAHAGQGGRPEDKANFALLLQVPPSSPPPPLFSLWYVFEVSFPSVSRVSFPECLWSYSPCVFFPLSFPSVSSVSLLVCRVYFPSVSAVSFPGVSEVPFPIVSEVSFPGVSGVPFPSASEFLSMVCLGFLSLVSLSFFRWCVWGSFP